jgi:hypothetical protein
MVSLPCRNAHVSVRMWDSLPSDHKMYGVADMNTPDWLDQFKAEERANDYIGCLIVSLLLVGAYLQGVV